jgi:hypothetical protein
MTAPLELCHTHDMLAFLISFILTAQALELPQGLSGNEQVRALEILGLGNTSSFLSNAYPLGGYSGFEVSLSMRSINTGDLSQLGLGTERTNDILVPTLTVGKGLYNNSDIFIHFMPPTKDQAVSKFGASYRWGFYEARFFPLNFSLVAHADMINIKNKISARNVGVDLLMGLTLSQFSFFLGGGYVNTSGDFQGGVSGLTASNSTESQKVDSSHFTFGGTYNFDPFFIGLSIDRYADSVYALKTGLLF